MNFWQRPTAVFSCSAPNILASCQVSKGLDAYVSLLTVCAAAPDDSRRSGVQCSVINQRRVTCTSVAAFLEPFFFYFSVSTLVAGCESPGTDNNAGD
jgi:hypothetical protein